MESDQQPDANRIAVMMIFLRSRFAPTVTSIAGHKKRTPGKSEKVARKVEESLAGGARQAVANVRFVDLAEGGGPET